MNKPPTPNHCRDCGTTDDARFEKRRHNLCMRCRSQARIAAQEKLDEPPLYTHHGSRLDSALAAARQEALHNLKTGPIDPATLTAAIERLQTKRQQLWRLQAHAPDARHIKHIEAITRKLDQLQPRLREIVARRRYRLNPRADDRLPAVHRIIQEMVV